MQARKRGRNVRLNFDEFQRRCIGLGWNTWESRATGIGISKSTMSRMVAGKYGASADVIAAVLTALGPGDFNELFTVEEEKEMEAA